MVGANTFREPALTAKMATTLDHISHGRATLGIGGAWFEEEHEAFGLEFGSGFPERLRWLGEALPVLRGMLHGERPTAGGDHYHARDVRNDPLPVQRRLPLLIGGGGEQVTLKLVAEYGDANNVGGGIERVRHKEEVLLRHCEAVGRDPSEIERTSGLGVVVIRDSREEARKVAEAIFARNGRAQPWENQPVGTPEDVTAFLAPYLEIGYHHLVAGFPSPYDEESMTRLATEVAPASPVSSPPRLVRPVRGRNEADRPGLAEPGLLLLPRPMAAGLRPVAARRHVAPAALPRAGLVVEDPATGVIGTDPEPPVVAVADLADDRLGDPGQDVVDRVTTVAVAHQDPVRRGRRARSARGRRAPG